MNLLIRSSVLALATALALSACNKPTTAPADKSGDAKTQDANATKYPGLPTEKDQASYAIGMAMGKQLSEIKDEVKLDMVIKALRTQMSGGKALINDDQAKEIMQGFSQKMQAKMLAKAMEEAKTNQEKGDKFLAENGKKPGVVTTASGLQYQVMTEGKGAKPSPSDGVKVNYKGSLIDGKVFDSSYERGEPAVMPLTGVIPGWSEALQLMPVGSKYKLWIPAKLAYGEQAPPMIGPNQMLEFEVELLDIVKPVDKQ